MFCSIPQTVEKANNGSLGLRLEISSVDQTNRRCKSPPLLEVPSWKWLLCRSAGKWRPKRSQTGGGSIQPWLLDHFERASSGLWDHSFLLALSPALQPRVSPARTGHAQMGPQLGQILRQTQRVCKFPQFGFGALARLTLRDSMPARDQGRHMRFSVLASL